MRHKKIFLLSSLLLSTHVFAWNAVGHRMVAQIAYDQLTPAVKVKVDALTAVMFHSPYPEARFMRAAVWPDKYRYKDKSTFYWHFIDLPIMRDGVTAKPVHAENVVWSILQAEKKLENSSAVNDERAKNLSFLIHFIGDSHQPLHCAELYSRVFPSGDRGGNLYRIQSPIADNLHQFWDRGAGLFYSDAVKYRFHYQQIEKMAHDWMQQYPRSFFVNSLKEQAPAQWVQDNHRIAEFVYSTPMNAAPSQAYVQQSQTIVRQQVVLAGDRLADALNNVLG
jgi:hypothetical protein